MHSYTNGGNDLELCKPFKSNRFSDEVYKPKLMVTELAWVWHV